MGSGGERSLVREEGGQLLLEALPGMPGEELGVGGAGYSGGGGYGNSKGGDGGAAGGNGNAGTGHYHGSGGQGGGGVLGGIPQADFLLR